MWLLGTQHCQTMTLYPLKYTFSSSTSSSKNDPALFRCAFDLESSAKLKRWVYFDGKKGLCCQHVIVATKVRGLCAVAGCCCAHVSL